jgi:hypothetical protein
MLRKAEKSVFSNPISESSPGKFPGSLGFTEDYIRKDILLHRAA